MLDEHEISVPDVSPIEAWESLKSPSAVLVDVRTIAEWDYVGEPDLTSLGKETLKVEWLEFPEDTINEYFADELLSQFDGNPEVVFFLCRSGRRSKHAARCIIKALDGTERDIRCVNIAEGFEGDHDAQKHRGTLNGWKVRGLPWHQP